MNSWDEWVRSELDSVAATGRWRTNTEFDAFGPEGRVDGRAVVSFASNDYLGLSAHPALRDAAAAAAEQWGTGATASRLIVGTRPVHQQLEQALAAWRGTDAALVFPSGFAANLGVLTVLADEQTTVFSDALNHASIIDGCRLSRARVERYRHNDVAQLDALLAVDRAANPDGRRLVVTDSVFSMDGDQAHVPELIDICVHHDALLVLDEAHAVLGPDVPSARNLPIVRVGTLSKALGSLGGFVAASQPVVDLLVNRARSYIFTTALSPADAAAALAAVQIVQSDEGRALTARLRAVIDRLAPGNPSPIVPVVVGDEDAAVKASRALFEDGVFVPAIRPPTVAPGTCRLRIALSAAHSDAMIDRLLGALDRVGLLDRITP
ncbi:MAG: aminotransferase class I/II-fold pyridoxal phosphate-dependent enzyme [Acidimicrobiia bacterium]